MNEAREQGSDTVSGTIAPVPQYADNAVLSAKEMREALAGISERQWYRVAPSLPVSYALGRKMPRYIYGEVVKYLKRTGAAA